MSARHLLPASAPALVHLQGRAKYGYRQLTGQARLAAFGTPGECLYLYSGAANFAASESTLALRRSLGVNFTVQGRHAIARLEPGPAPNLDRCLPYHGPWLLSSPTHLPLPLPASQSASGLHSATRSATPAQPQPCH